jgi:two-component system nitrate/nitrite response regulator NarL
MLEHNIKVLVVDDHKGVLENITAILNREPDIEVVGTAQDGYEAIKSAESLHPDVIIMDVSMPVLDGISAAGEIKAHSNPAEIIMLSMHHNSVLVQQARKNGASGYVTKQNVIPDLIPAVRAAYEGELFL